MNEIKDAGICRICSLVPVDTVSIFETRYEGWNRVVTLQEIIKELANVQVFLGDGLPSSVCSECKDALLEYYTFKRLVEDSDARLRKNLLKEHDYMQEWSVETVDTDENLKLSVDTNDKDDDFTEEECTMNFNELNEEEINVLDKTYKNSHENINQDDIKVVKVAGEQRRVIISPDIKLVPTNKMRGNRKLFIVVPTVSKTHPSNQSKSKDANLRCEFCNTFFLSAKTFSMHRKLCQININEKLVTNQEFKESSRSEEGFINVGAEFEIMDVDNNVHNILPVPQNESEESLDKSNELNNLNSANVLKTLNSEKLDNCGASEELNETISCSLCNKGLGKNSLRNHMKYVHSVNLKYHTCTLCKKAFKQAAGLKRHQEEIHSVIKSFEKFECDVCKKEMKSRRCLLMHKRIIHSDKRFKCDICNKVFKQLVNLRRHVKEIHCLESNEKDVKCSSCGKILSSKRQLRSHEKYVHSENYQFDCSDCGKSFKYQTSFKRHQTEVHGETAKYSCNNCNRTFSNVYLLNYHKKIKFCVNVDVKKCDYCDKTFYNDFKMKAHIRSVHTDYLVRVCEICGANVKNLNNHVKQVHSDLKLVQCSHCNIFLPNFKEMLRHRKTHVLDEKV